MVSSPHLVGLDSTGKPRLKKKLSRTKLLAYFATLTPCKISMEGCAGAHYWARELRKFDHQVRLLPAQYVKAYVRGNKNDYNDALTIAEASRVSQMRDVAVKTIEQQSIQALHRLRQRAVGDGAGLSNPRTWDAVYLLLAIIQTGLTVQYPYPQNH